MKNEDSVQRRMLSVFLGSDLHSDQIPIALLVFLATTAMVFILVLSPILSAQDALPTWLAQIIAPIISVVFGIVGLVLVYVQIENNRKLARIKNTMDILLRLEADKEWVKLCDFCKVNHGNDALLKAFEDHYEDWRNCEKKTRKECGKILQYLNIWELIALGYFNGFFEKDVVKSMYSDFVCKLWKENESYIKAMRKVNSCFEEFEKLVKEFELPDEDKNKININRCTESVIT